MFTASHDDRFMNNNDSDVRLVQSRVSRVQWIITRRWWSIKTTDIWCWNLQAWLMIVLWRENCVNDENLRVYCFSISLLHSARKMSDSRNRLSQNLNLKILAENCLPSAPFSCSDDYKKIVWGVRSVTNWWQCDTVWHSVTQDHVTLSHADAAPEVWGLCHLPLLLHLSSSKDKGSLPAKIIQKKVESKLRLNGVEWNCRRI